MVTLKSAKPCFLQGVLIHFHKRYLMATWCLKKKVTIKNIPQYPKILPYFFLYSFKMVQRRSQLYLYKTLPAEFSSWPLRAATVVNRWWLSTVRMNNNCFTYAKKNIPGSSWRGELMTCINSVITSCLMRNWFLVQKKQNFLFFLLYIRKETWFKIVCREITHCSAEHSHDILVH